MNDIQLSSLIGPLIEQYVKERGRKPFDLILDQAHQSESREGTKGDDTIPDDTLVIPNPRFDMPVLVDERDDALDL
jgi:hypothetical protein